MCFRFRVHRVTNRGHFSHNTNGFKVAGIDINEKVVNTIQKGEIHIKEQNTFRDVNIALANELCKIACDLNLNALEIIKLANMHPRVNLHQPGPGVGGHWEI